MQINFVSKNNLNRSFTSKNNPIKPYNVKTRYGTIHFQEVNYSRPIKRSNLEKISVFVTDNLHDSFKTPLEQQLKKDSYFFDKNLYRQWINLSIEDLQKALLNPDTTLLIGTDENNKICAVLHSKPLELSDKLKDDETIYVDTCSVDRKYQGMGIGKILIEKLKETSSSSFKKMALVSVEEAKFFYRKLGFKRVKDPIQRQEFEKVRYKYLNGAEFLNMQI